uniref:tRNA-2-methylthio-N(6)-dimethylallyladenosine synthase n=1 Tax=candidate division WOR-3 bacterium TaxID=2052148 RepID=A0A7C4YF10_UNCW3
MIEHMEKKYKNFHIITYGCQMNIYDSNILKDILLLNGYNYTENIRDANIIFINGCSVREHAEKRALGRFFNLKKDGVKIGFIGCLGKNLKDKGFNSADFLMGPDDYKNAVKIIEEGIYIEKENELYDDVIYKNKSISSYVAITRGCDNFCSYCIVPYLRGRLRSRPYHSILKEVHTLKENGVKEVILIGQNVNEYYYEGVNFTELLRMVSDTGIKMISFLTSHPKDVDLNIFRLMKERENITRYLHLPVQSGSDRILKLMGRGYTSEEYIDLIGRIRDIVDDITLTTDILVGFPSEREEDFEKTVELIKMIRFDYAFMFRYSPREKTLSSLMDEFIDDEEKKRRLRKVIGIQYVITKEKSLNMLGKRKKCIGLSYAKKGGILCKGFDGKNIVVNEDAELGKEMEVEIIDVQGNTLIGKILKKEE